MTRSSDDGKKGPKRDAMGRLTGGNPGNRGGQKGRSGRRKSEWTEMCERLAVGIRHRRALKKILSNPAHPAFSSVSRMIAEHAFGKPQTTIDAKMTMTLEDLVGDDDDAE